MSEAHQLYDYVLCLIMWIAKEFFFFYAVCNVVFCPVFPLPDRLHSMTVISQPCPGPGSSNGS